MPTAVDPSTMSISASRYVPLRRGKSFRQRRRLAAKQSASPAGSDKSLDFIGSAADRHSVKAEKDRSVRCQQHFNSNSFCLGNGGDLRFRQPVGGIDPAIPYPTRTSGVIDANSETIENEIVDRKAKHLFFMMSRIKNNEEANALGFAGQNEFVDTEHGISLALEVNSIGNAFDCPSGPGLTVIDNIQLLQLRPGWFKDFGFPGRACEGEQPCVDIQIS